MKLRCMNGFKKYYTAEGYKPWSRVARFTD